MYGPPNCASPGLKVCELCLPGFYKTSVLGENTEHTGDIVCELCQVGTTWNEYTETCETNDCRCRDGTPSTGVSCLFNGDESCNSCDLGYHLTDDTGTVDGKKVQACHENQCSCLHGEPAAGQDCPNHGEEWCVKCSSSEFQLNYEGDKATCQSCTAMLIIFIQLITLTLTKW